MSSPDVGMGRALAPFRSPAYRKLALALVLSTFAAGVWAVALVWEVIRLGGAATQLSLVVTAGAIAVIVPALLGGVVADRVPQKRILIGVSLVELTGMALVAVASALDASTLWLLAGVAVTSGVGMAFYYPAYSAWLPSLVPASALQAVNGFEGMVRPAVQQAIGPAVAGVAVAAIAPAAAFGIAAAASFIGLIALLSVPQTPVRRTLDDSGAHPMRAMLRDIGEGFRYLRQTAWLLWTLVFAALLSLVVMGPLEVLIPFLIKDNLGGGPRDHAWVLAGFGIGGAVGSLIMGALRMPRRYLTLMIGGWGLSCLPFLLIGTTRHIWVVVACTIVMGALFSAPMVIWGTLLQRRVPPHMLGRVASLDFFISISLMPVSMALAGPVSQVFGLRNTFLVAGSVPLLLAILAITMGKLRADEAAHPLDVPADSDGGSVGAEPGDVTDAEPLTGGLQRREHE